MERNFTKTRLAARRTPSAETRWRLILWIGIIFVAICTILFCSYLYKSKAIQSIAANSYVSRVGAWLEERKTHLQNGASKPNVTRLASGQDSAESQIHFEFYNALPSMQVATSDPIPKTVIPKAVVAKETIKKPVVKQTTEIARAKPQKPVAKVRLAQQTAQQPKSKAKQTPFGLVVSAEELERELSDQLKQKQYIIQLGMFRDSQAAKRYRKVLSRAGFTVTVVKIKEGNKRAYRIQQGPFLNVYRAKSAQKSLQKRGIASLVVRMNQG